MNSIFQSSFLPDNRYFNLFLPLSALECLFSAKHIVSAQYFFILGIGKEVHKYDRKDGIKFGKPNGNQKNDRRSGSRTLQICSDYYD